MRRWTILALALACRARGAAPTAADAGARASTCADRRELATGLTLERIPDGDGCITLVRVAPDRFRLVLRTALVDGGARPAPAWADAFRLVGVINASMFQPDLRSIGLLVTGKVENNPRDNPKLGAYFAFDPVDAADPPWTLLGRGCPEDDPAALRARYRTVVQNYRMLDCDGRAVDWKDDKEHSAAAVGIDKDGRAVLVLSPVPHRVAEHSRLLAAPALGLRRLMYVEGGPEASLYVRAGGTTVSEMGRLDVGFSAFWSIPNVIGVMPKE
jgi:hypothetical protein